MKKKLLVIFGPTGSGKSDLAVILSKKFKGEVISADSRQVYRHLDIGTGKITKKEMKGIPHHLLSFVSPKRIFTVKEFREKALKIIEKIHQKNKLPILCGGSNFWIQVVADGLKFPEVKPDYKLREKLAKLSSQELYLILQKLDKKRAKTIEPKNKRRLIRAIEIIKKTKKSIPKIGFTKNFDTLKIALFLEKEELEKRIEKRLNEWLKKGLLEEVKKLRKMKVSWRRIEDFGLEYKWLSLYLRGKINYQEMKEKSLRSIIKYSKKQLSWLRNKEKDVVWLDVSKKNWQKKVEKMVALWLSKKEEKRKKEGLSILEGRRKRKELKISLKGKSSKKIS